MGSQSNSSSLVSGLFILSTVSIAWAAICWLSGSYDEPFLNLLIFSLAPSVPLISGFIALLGGVVIRVIRSRPNWLTDKIKFFKENRRILILLVGLLILFWFLQIPSIIMFRGVTHFDSSVYDLESYHIADGKSRPIFKYTKPFNGTLVPHLTALLHSVFGKSPVTLRLVVYSFYSGFIILLFFLARRIFGTKTGLIAAAFAAVPPYIVFSFFGFHPYFEVLLWGTLSALLLTNIVNSSNSAPRWYYWYGLVCGLGFYANYQFLYFIFTGMALLFIREKLFLLRPRMLLIPAGFVFGSIGNFVFGYYHKWSNFLFIVGGAGAGPSILERLPGGFENFFDVLGWFLTVRPYLGLDFFPLNALGLLLFFFFVASVFWYLWRYREDLVRVLRLKNVEAFTAYAPILILVSMAIFVVSKRVQYSSQFYYLMSIWTIIPVFLAVAVRDILEQKKYLGITVLALIMLTFFGSQLFYHYDNYSRELAYQEFENFCQDHNITRVYTSFTRAYPINHFTSEEIICSTTFHGPRDWYLPYQAAVADSSIPPAYLLRPEETGELEYLETQLRNLSIGYRKAHLTVGTLFFEFSEKVTPPRLANLEGGKYQARIESCRVQEIIGTGAGDTIVLVTVTVRNSGEVVWKADATRGNLELVLTGPGGAELRRVPLHRDVQVNSHVNFKLLMSKSVLSEESKALLVQVNDIVISETKSPYTPTESNLEWGSAVSAESMEIMEGVDLPSEGLFPVSGWGPIRRHNNKSVAWSGAGRSSYVFLLREAKSTEIMIQARPFKGDTMPEGIQWLAVSCNGCKLGSRIFLTKRQTFLVTIPKSVTRPGLNRLKFEYALMEKRYCPLDDKPNFRLRPKAVGFEKITLRTQ